mmetsp:Transcript_56202/g.131609  ORF Transcript_56202/g.131609 Transcript_56202/m.131609 type:complete len:762 (-) Transcript_56202:12-2297(-)
MDRLTGEPLLARVCSEDPSLHISATHIDMNDRMKQYRPKMYGGAWIERSFDGMIMCLLALVCYYLAIAKELHAVSDQVNAMLAIKSGDRTKVTKRGRIVQLSHLRKCIALGTAAVRVGLVCGLAYSGTLFLVHDISIQDLLLNAVALEFVLNIDELIYAAACPEPAKKVLEGLKPLPSNRLRYIYGLELKALALTVFIFVGVILVNFTILGNLVDLLQQTEQEMCGLAGTEFVTHLSLDGFMAMSRTGIENGTGDLSSSFRNMQQVAVQQIVLEGVSHTRIPWERSLDSLPTWATLTFDRVVSLTSEFDAECEDHWIDDVYEERENHGIFKQVQYLVTEQVKAKMGFTPESCQDLESFCWNRENAVTNNRVLDVGQLARFICPVACGCNLTGGYPFEPTLDQGCQDLCMQGADQLITDRLECGDYQAPVLAASPAWERWVEQALVEYNHDLANFTLETALTAGCSILELAPLGMRQELCFGLTGLKRWSYYCPVACGCQADLSSPEANIVFDSMQTAKTYYDDPATTPCPKRCVAQQVCWNYTAISSLLCDATKLPADAEDSTDSVNYPFVDQNNWDVWHENCIEEWEQEEFREYTDEDEHLDLNKQFKLCYDCDQLTRADFCVLNPAELIGGTDTYASPYWVWDDVTRAAIPLASNSRSIAATLGVYYFMCVNPKFTTIAEIGQVYENLTESESENYELYVEETVTFCQHLVCDHQDLEKDRRCQACIELVEEADPISYLEACVPDYSPSPSIPSFGPSN